MIPRTKIVAMDILAPIKDIKDEFIATKLSKILIYKGNIDWKINNKNIVYLKHSNINLSQLNKYFINSSPIDQKPDNVTYLKLNFLNNNIPFHSFLVNNAIANKGNSWSERRFKTDAAAAVVN